MMMKNRQGKKVAAITGATGAIGKAIALELAKLGYQVVLIARNSEKCSRSAGEISAIAQNNLVSSKIADLSKKRSIEDLVETWQGPLHVLVNNAAVTPPDRLETEEGIELQLATNVLGYFWMTKYFADIMAASSPSRVINVASYWAGGLDLNDLEFTRRPYHNHDAYRQSKQANRMLTPVFAAKLKSKGISVNASHPGDVNSALSNSLGFGGSQSPAAGARTPVWLAASATLENVTGKYFENLTETACPFGAQTGPSAQLYEICSTY
jgi:NAD(P)-dependent dehydrogenase (short-subunit alcohol dehydrogenase family)